MKSSADTRPFGGEDEIRLHAELLNVVGQAVIATDLEGRLIFWKSSGRATLRLDRRRAPRTPRARSFQPSGARTPQTLSRAGVPASTGRGRSPLGGRAGARCRFW